MGKPQAMSNLLRESNIKLATGVSPEEKRGLFATVSQKTLQRYTLEGKSDGLARNNELLGKLSIRHE